MSQLQQFRQPGGFHQLLRVFEVSEPTRQKNLLLLVAGEDPGWAHLLLVKCLTLEKILQWPKVSLTHALSTIPTALVGQIYFQLALADQKKIEACVSNRTLREMKEYLAAQNPNDLDGFAAQVKLLQGIRELEAMGVFSLHDVDPTLAIEQKLVA